MALPARRESATLFDVLDRVLDKGLVINADITVSIVGVELLGVKVRAAIASFETAAKYGLEFPSGTRLNAPGWKHLEPPREEAPVYLESSEQKRLADHTAALSAYEPGMAAKSKGLRPTRN